MALPVLSWEAQYVCGPLCLATYVGFASLHLPHALWKSRGRRQGIRIQELSGWQTWFCHSYRVPGHSRWSARRFLLPRQEYPLPRQVVSQEYPLPRQVVSYGHQHLRQVISWGPVHILTSSYSRHCSLPSKLWSPGSNLSSSWQDLSSCHPAPL